MISKYTQEDQRMKLLNFLLVMAKLDTLDNVIDVWNKDIVRVISLYCLDDDSI